MIASTKKSLRKLNQTFGFNQLMDALVQETFNEFSTCDIQKILDETTDFNHIDTRNNTALMLACQYNLDWVMLILNKMDKNNFLNSINFKNIDNNTALMLLIKNINYSKTISLIEPLIKLGANIHLKNKGGSDVLNEATSCCNLEAVKILLANGASINTTSIKGDTPLMTALRYTGIEKSKPVVLALLKHHPDTTVKNIYNETALDIAKKLTPLLAEVLMDYFNYLEILKEEKNIKNKVDVDIQLVNKVKIL